MINIVKLRGHHLLCILTHIGRGYTKAFTENMSAIAERIGQGAVIEIVAGLDDICAALHKVPDDDYQDADHCFKAALTMRDAKALNDVGTVINQTLVLGDKLTFTKEIITDLRRAFAKGTIRVACGGCEWHDICTGIAADDYDGVKLYPHAC